MTNKTIIANWKMNGSVGLIDELCPALANWAADDPRTKAVVCPPFPYIAMVKNAFFDTYIGVGGQDCHAEASGAFTGNISADMLVDTGCSYVIVGHSERREQHGETDAQVQAKATQAREAGLIPVICVGESLEVRESGNAVETVVAQAKASVPADDASNPLLADKPEIILAYEPIWAIGTGRIPAMEDIEEMHQALKAQFGADMQMLYGGSVKASNAAEILTLDGVDGALVGGASLKKEEFLAILTASEQ